MRLHVLDREDDAVDRAEAGVGDEDAGELKLPKHVFELDTTLIDAERAEDAAAALHRDVVILRGDLEIALTNHRHIDRMPLDAGCEVRGPGVLIDVRAHLPERLRDTGELLHEQRIPRDERPVRAARIAAHRRLIIGRMLPGLLKLLHDQPRDIGFSDIGARAGDKYCFTH